MKKVLSILLLVASLFVLFGCKVKDNGNGNNQSGGSHSKPTTAGAYVQVIVNGEINKQAQTDLFSSLIYDLGLDARFFDDTSERAEREIVIGKTNRDISSTAYRKLNRVEKESESDVSYLIYVDGNNIAIAYEEDKFGIEAALLSVINHFVEETVPAMGSGSLKNGVIYSGSIDPIAYQKALDEQEKEIEWSILKKYAGEDVVAATKEYYSMISDKVVTWMADLYDPETGGFYYSNSGRNTVGYLPDIESTFNILSMLETSGMLDHLGTNYKKLPDWFLKKMAIWVKDMQDPNGYFYHPQWGKALTDTNSNRRSRDLNYGITIIYAANMKPTYDTSTGAKGDYTLSDGTEVDASGNPIVAVNHLTNKLGVSTAHAVSKVVPTAEASVASHLKTVESFKNYLSTLDIRNNSYSVGSELSNQVSQIKQRDKELGGTLIPVLKKWFLDNYNPANGTWYHKSENDPSYSYYGAVNGLMKILNVLNSFGIAHPGPIAASDTVIKAIYCDEDVTSVVSAYNSWVALERILENIEDYSDNTTQARDTVSEIRERIRNDAPNLIKLTAEKAAVCLKPDGSSSYTPTASSATSQGMRVAVPGTNEGDTNATMLNTFGTFGHMFSVFGWEYPTMFGKAEYFVFMDTIENQDNVIKDEVVAAEPYTFDDDSVDSVPVIVNVEECKSSGVRKVVQTNKPKGSGNVFLFESVNDGNDNIYILSESLALNASCFVFESELCLETAQTGILARLYLDSCYLINFNVKDGRVHFIDSANKDTTVFVRDLGHSVAVGEWFKIRVEYYTGEADTVRIKTYLNDELIAVSDNFYNPDGKGVPSSYYSSARFEVLKSASVNLYIDNCLADKNNNIYKEELDPEKQPTINVDSPDMDEIIYDFENVDVGNYPEGWFVTADNSDITVQEQNNNRYLLMTGNSSSSVNIPINVRSKDANAYKFEADFTVNSIEKGSKIEIMFREMGVLNTAIMRLWLVPITENGETYLTMYEAASGTIGAELGVRIPIGDQVKLKINYYGDRNATLIYINDKLVATSTAVEIYANRACAGKVEINNLASGSVDVMFDNIIVEKEINSFDIAVQPELEGIIHGFETGLPENGSLEGAVIVADNSGNKVVSFKNAGTLTIPVNKRSAQRNAFVINATVKISTDTPDGSDLAICLKDSSGNIIISYCIKVSGTVANVYETTGSKTYSTPIASFTIGNNTSLAIEYYKKQDVAQIFIDGNCVAITSITYSENSGKLDAESVSFSSSMNGANITVDNVVAESYDKFFVVQSADGENADDAKTVIGFEESTTGNLPERITSELNSSSAAIRVKEIIRGGKATKVLSWESKGDYVDYLYIGKTKEIQNYNAIVFTTDICFTNCESGTIYLYFWNGNKTFCKISLSLGTDGNITVDDYYDGDRTISAGAGKTGVKGKAWTTLKLSIYSVNGESKVLINVGDSYQVISSISYFASASIEQITSFRIDTSKYTSATILLDNISLEEAKIEIPAEPIPHEHEYSSSLTYDTQNHWYKAICSEESDCSVSVKDLAPHSFDNNGYCICGYEKPKEPEKVTEYNFNDGNLPSGVTAEFNSSGASIKVTDDPLDNTGDKVLSWDTNSGGVDFLYFKPINTEANANKVIFETNFYVDAATNSGQAFEYVNGDTKVGYIIITMQKDGRLKVSDYDDGTNSFSSKYIDIGEPKWVTLKLVSYTNTDGVFCTEIWVNESLIATSTNAKYANTTVGKITRMRIRAYKADDASIYFDDVKFDKVSE